MRYIILAQIHLLL